MHETEDTATVAAQGGSESHQDELYPVRTTKDIVTRTLVIMLYIAGCVFAFVYYLIAYVVIWTPFVRGFVSALFLSVVIFSCFFVTGIIRKRPRTREAAKRAIARKVALSLVALALLVCDGVMGYQLYQESLIISESSYAVNPRDYRPFSNSPNLSHLSYEASLRFDEQDDLPVLDGATALLPVYASAVEAMYPSTSTFDDGGGSAASVSYSGQNPAATTSEKSLPYPDNVLQCSSTPAAYRALMRGECDVIFCAAPSEEQAAEAEREGVEFVYTPLGREGFVFFVNENNPITSLSSSELRALYTGDITNWSDLGGQDIEIAPYQRNEGSGSQSVFLRFMGSTTPLTPETIYTPNVMGGIMERVADYKDGAAAIGFSFHYFTQEMLAGHPIKLLSVDGIAPTQETIASGAYPLTDEFYAVTRSDNTNPNVGRLLEWLQSEEGQELIELVGYAPYQ